MPLWPLAGFARAGASVFLWGVLRAAAFTGRCVIGDKTPCFGAKGVFFLLKRWYLLALTPCCCRPEGRLLPGKQKIIAGLIFVFRAFELTLHPGTNTLF